MINNLRNIVSAEVARYVDGACAVPHDKKEETTRNATLAIMQELKRYAMPENLPSLMSLVSPEMSGTQFGASSMLQDMQDRVVSTLVNREGFDQSMAEGIGATAIPAVITMLAGKVADPAAEDFTADTLAAALAGWNDEP